MLNLRMEKYAGGTVKVNDGHRMITLVDDNDHMHVQERDGGLGFDKVLAIAPTYFNWSDESMKLFRRVFFIPEGETFKSILQRGYYTMGHKDIAVIIDMTLDRYKYND